MTRLTYADGTPIKAGDAVTWKRTMRGGYGFIRNVPATVEQVGAYRVRISYIARHETEGDQTFVVGVKPESLERRDG